MPNEFDAALSHFKPDPKALEAARKKQAVSESYYADGYNQGLKVKRQAEIEAAKAQAEQEAIAKEQARLDKAKAQADRKQQLAAQETAFVRAGRPFTTLATGELIPTHTDEQWKTLQTEKAQEKEQAAQGKYDAAWRKQEGVRISQDQDKLKAGIDDFKNAENLSSQAVQAKAGHIAALKQTVTDAENDQLAPAKRAQITADPHYQAWLAKQAPEVRSNPLHLADYLNENLTAARDEKVMLEDNERTLRIAKTNRELQIKPDLDKLDAQRTALPVTSAPALPKGAGASLNTDLPRQRAAASTDPERSDFVLRDYITQLREKGDFKRADALQKRLTNPTAAEAEQRAFREKATPEELNTAITTGQQQIQQGLEQSNKEYAAITAERQAFHARLAKATERNTALLAQPYSDGDVITVADNNTGAEQRWHKAAFNEFNGAASGLQEWEKTNQPKIDLLDLDRQQLLLDAKNLDRHKAQSDFLKREAGREQDAKFATEMDSMRQNPLTASAADEITALRDDTRKRGRELAAKYDPRPQIQALKDEIEPRMQQAAAIVDPAQRAKAIEQLKTEQQTRLEAINQAANSTEHQAARLALETEGKTKHEAIKKGLEDKALAAADIYNTWAKDPKGNILNVTDWVNDTDFTPRLKQEAAKRGLTEKEARYALDYARKADWSHPLVGPASKGDNTRTVKDGIGSGLRGLIYGTEPAEASRNLPDGTLSINPELWLDKAAYDKAVASSVTSKDAKAKAGEQFQKLNELASNNIVGQLEKEVALPGLPDFNNWRKAKLEASTNYARTSLGKQALEYLAEMRARPEGAQWADSLMRNLAKGVVDLGAMVYGNALLISGSKTMGELASNSINLGEGLLAAADQKTDLGKGGGLAAIAFRAGNLTAQLMPQMAPMIIGGGLLAGMGKIGAMAAASLMGGLQTSGLQQASVYTKLKETINPATGQPYTHNEAWLKAAPGAIASGIVTGILTSLGGPLGGEAALATLLTRAGREAQRAAIKTAYNGVWNTLKTITGHAAGEIADEVPDELFSQISEEISLKGNKADLPGVIENFIKSSPELILAVGAMGAGGGTFGDLSQRSQLANGVRAEDVAAASAQIEGYTPEADEGTVDPLEIQNRKSRAAIAMAVAQGLDLSTLDETTLNAAGWTRKDKDGRTRADGALTKLKDYAGPNVLDIDTAGKIKLDTTYVGNLEKRLPSVHAMIGKQHLNWHTPASIEPTTSAPAAAKDGTSPTAQVPTASAASGTPASAAGKSAPISPAAAPAASASSPGGAGAAPTATAPARGVSAQGAAPATAQDAGGSPQVAAPAVSGAAADSKEALLPHFPDIKDPADPRVQRAWEISNHLEMAGLDRDTANLIAAGEIRARGVAAGGVNGQVTSVPFNEMLSDLGVTGDRTTREGSEPLKLPADGLAKLRGRQAVKIKVKTTGALGHPDLAQHTTPGHRAQEQMLEARGVKVHTVETEADAEKLIGASLKSKGRRGVTVLIDGKPTVIFVAENFRNKPADGGAVIDHEFHHAAALLVLNQKPELLAKAQSEAAYLPNGESIYSGWKSLTPMGKLIEAAAAYAAGTWNPDQSSAIRQLVDAIIDAIAKAFGLSTTEASAISADTIRQLADEASAILGQDSASRKPAKKGNPVAPNNVGYPALRAKIAAKEISIIDAVREAARLSGQHDTGELQDILTDHLGVKKLSAAAAVEALRANGELTGNKEDIPLAAGAKASQRTPKFTERDRFQAAPHFQPQPTDKATTSHEFGRARIAAIAALPPRARRWGTRYLNALEGILEQNHTIFEAFMIGPNAKRILNGQQAAVSTVQGRVTLLLDLPKLMAQMSDLGDPRRRAAQTINEETWHAAQLHLERSQPGKWNKASLAAQWAALPVKLQRTVYTAYHNANPKASKTMPKTWTPDAAYAMHSEFLRMLGQGLIDPSDITESVDVGLSLIQSIRDLLADLYNTLRQLIKGLPASQATSLDQQVAELRAVRDAMLQSGPSDGRGIAGKVFLQDPVMHAQQALESGAVFDQLAKTDAIFKPEGLRRVWDLMTPEVQAKVLALKQTAPDFLKSKRTDKADLTRDLLTLLMDPRAASAMAQLNLAPDQPAAKTGTSMLRRALRAMGNYFRTPASKDQYAALVAKLDLHSATVLGSMRGLILRSQAEFSAAAMVQALPILTPKTNADDKEAPSESATVWKSAQQSAQAMVAAWMQEAQRQAFLNAVLTEQEAAANHTLPGVADAVMRQSLARQMAGLTWDSLKARMEANMLPPLILGGEQQNQQAPRPLALPSPAQRSAQAIEEALRDQENERQWNSSPAARDAIARKLAQEESAAAILHTAGLSERQAYARNGAGFDELRAIEAMIRVASGELTLSRQSERRTLSTNPETGAPVRIIGVTKEADLAALGITIEPDGTAHADVNAPVYIENGRIIIKQTTMDSLAETLPITRQQIRMSEAETRAMYGMQPNAAPVTVDTIAAGNADRAAAISERRMRNRLEELENQEAGNDVGPLVDPATEEDGRLQGSADLITWLGREGWSLGWPTEKSGGEWDWFTELLSQYYSDTAGRRTRRRRTKDKDGNVVVKQVSMPAATKRGVTQAAKTAAQQGDLSTDAALVEWLILQGVVTPPDLHSTTRDTNLAPHQPGGGGIDEVDNAAQEANYDIPDGIGNAVIAALEAREAARHNRANNPETGAELQTLRFSRDTNRGPVAVSVGELAQLAADGPATVVLRDPDGEETSMQVSEPQWRPMDPDTREMEDYLDHSPWFRGREQGNPERMVVTFSGDTKYGTQTLGAEAVIRVASEGHTSLGVNMDSDSESYIDDFADPDQTPTSEEEASDDEDAAYQEEPAPDYGLPEAEEDDTFGLTPEQLAEIDAILNGVDGDSSPTMGASARHNFTPELIEEARREMKANADDPDYKGDNAWMTPDGRFINLGGGSHYEASGIVYDHGYGPAMAAGYVRITMEGDQMFAEFFGPLSRRIQRQVRDGAIEQQINPDNVNFEPFAEQHYGSSKYDEETGDLLLASDRAQSIRDGIRKRWDAEYSGEDPLDAGAWWIDRSGNILPVVAEHNEIAEDLPAGTEPLGAAFDLGFLRASTDLRMGGDDQDVFYQAGEGHRPTQYQKRALQQIADHKGGEVISDNDPRNLFLGASDRFYSQLERTVEAKMPNRSDAKTLRGLLENPQNRIKAEELKWSGILAWADSQPQPLTKQQVLDYLKTEGSVRFEETRMGGPRENPEQLSLHDQFSALTDQMADLRRQTEEGLLTEAQAAAEYRRISDERDTLQPRYDAIKRKDLQLATRNTRWTMPGGTNDREVVVMWKQATQTPAEILQKVGLNEERDNRNNIYVTDSQNRRVYREGSHFYEPTNPKHRLANTKEAEAIEKASLADKPQPSPNDTSDKTHYGDLDALAWFRANDRTDGLFVEEFQSKWHQLGREKGYAEPASEQELNALLIKENLTDADRDRIRTLKANLRGATIPDAPYRTAWPLTLFKRALADAVAEGKQWIGWTVGDTQADRYNLSKVIDTINVRSAGPDTYEVTATNEDKRVIHERDLTADKLAETIGKELAKKAIERLANGGVDPTQQNRYEQDWQQLSAAREKLLKVEKQEIGHNKFGVRQAANGLWEAYYTQDAIAANGANAPANPAWQGMGNTIAGGYSSERRASLGIPDYMAGGFNRTSSGTLQEALTQYQTAYNILWREHENNNISPDATTEWATFTGLDLKVGGEGMRKFYDDMLVKEFGKYVKQWGGKVEKSSTYTGPSETEYKPIGYRVRPVAGQFGVFAPGETRPMNPVQPTELAAQEFIDRLEAVRQKISSDYQIPIWRIDITDAMRESVSTGQALFSSDRILASSQRRNEAIAVARTALKVRLTFDQFRQMMRKRAPADKWNEYAPYLEEAWQVAQQPETPKTPAQPIVGPAPKFDSAAWALGLGESPVPDPYMDPPGRRSAEPAKRAETPANAPATSPPPQSIETPAAVPVTAPQSVEEFFQVIAANPNWIQSEETTGFKETPKLKRYGALAGKYLRSDLVLDVRDIAENTPLSPDTYSHFLSTWPQAREKVIHNYGANAEQRQQAIDESFGPLDPSIEVLNTKNSKGQTVPHVMRGRGLMVKLEGVPHVAMRQVALPSIGTGLDQGERFLPLAGDKSRWTGHINRAIAKAFPNLDAETDVYIEPYGGGLVYLQNLHILLNTKKQIIIASSIEYEPDRNLLYMALKKGDPATMEDIRFTLAAVDKHKPKTAAGRAAQELLWGNKEDEEGVVIEPKKASLAALKQVDKLAKLLQRPNVVIVPWSDQQTFDEAVLHAKSGQRVTLLEDSNYADLPGEETEDQYAKIADHPELIGLFSDKPKAPYIGKDPAKLLKQKLPVYRSVLGANGTIIATNNMNPILINGLLAEFGDQGHWLGYAHPTRPVPDGWMRHPDNKGVLWSTERPEYLAILRKGVDSKTPKYGYSTDKGLNLRNGQRRNAADLNREAQAYRAPSPHTGGSPDAAADALRRADASRSQGKLGASDALRENGSPVAETARGDARGHSSAQKVPGGAEPKLKYPMTPLEEGKKVSRLELAKWQEDQDQQRDLASAADTLDDEISSRIDDPDNEGKYGPLPAAIRQAFPRVSPPTGEEIRQILSKPHGTPLASAPRRARQSMEFQPPFRTSFGDILTYHWMSKGLDGTDMRVSDWDKSRTNAQTGRDIVHHFKVRRSDGSIHTVSLESALGQLSDEQRSRLNKTIRSIQKQMALPAEEQLGLDTEPPRTPVDNSRDLTIYRKLTEASTIKPLRPDQSQMLEQAERNLGQTFLGFAAKPVIPTLSLEPEVTRTHDLTRTPTTEQLRLFASNRILAAAARTNTNPSKAQVDAENYETGKVTVHGLRLSIENPAGSVRKGTDANGKAWEVTMPHHYGRILGTTGADKDHVDFFLGRDHTSPTAFVINQKKPGNGHFDETKVMLGFTNAGAAARGYLDSYTKGWRGYSSIVPMTIPQLKHWLENGNMADPVTKAPVVSNDTTALASSERQVWHSGSIQGAYDPTKADMDAAYGPGFYASISKKRSEGYGKQPARLFTVTAQRWFDHDARIDRAEALRLANLLEVPEALDSLFADELESGTPIIGEDVWNALKKATSPLMANEALAQAGYDGATYTGNRGKDRDYIVWNADQITEIAPVSQSSPLPASARQPLPAAPDLEDYQPWGKDKTTRDSEWKRYRTDRAKWEAKVAEFASKQGNLGTFLAPLKSYPSGQAYREARVITRVPGDATRWRATIFGQQPITAQSSPVGEWANNAWVPVAHNEFETKAEAYQDSARSMPEGYTFSTQPLFASPRGDFALDKPESAERVKAAYKYWDQLRANRDSVFLLGPTPTSSDINVIAKAYSTEESPITVKHKGKVKGVDSAETWEIHTPTGIAYLERIGRQLYLNSSDVSGPDMTSGVKGAGGTQAYQIAMTFAHNQVDAKGQPAPMEFIPDPRDVSVLARIRRISQMFSSALRHRTTKHLYPMLIMRNSSDPDAAKLRGKFEIPGWKEGDTEGNIGRLALMEMKLVSEHYPEINQWQIDPKRGIFTYGNGTPVTRNLIEQIIAKLDPGNTGTGEATLLRAVHTRRAVSDNTTSGSVGLRTPLEGLHPGGTSTDLSPLRDSEVRILYASPRQVSDQISSASFNHLDRKLHSALARMVERVTATDTVAAATQAIAAWYGKDAPTSNVVRSMKEFAQRELIPETVLPREIMSALHQMQIKQSMGQQQALDVGRALSGNPKFSDLAYPAEFVENPMYREQMFTAMEQGKVDTLPPALQTMAHQLRKLLVDAGREAVKQGRMSPDTFEGLRTNYMPRFTKDEAQASAGDWAKAFKLGVRDILAQRSTAWHITDTTRKDKHGLPVLIQHSGKKWRFDSAQARDAYYESLINRETIDGDMANTDWHWMSRSDSRTLRSITPDMLAAPATMTKEQRDIVHRVQRQLRQQFKKEAPYEPEDLVKDPVYAVMRYLAQMTHDNATAEFFNLILTNPDWVSSTESKGFTQIPDNDRFGRLSGKWVKKEIADQVLEMAEASNQFWQLYDSLLRLWKTGKTILNPATHARNIIGNIPFSQFAGNNILNPTNAPHYLKALRVLREGGDEYRHLYESGVLGADYASTELRAALEAIVPVVQTEPDSASPIKHLIALGNRAAQWGKAHSLANVATLATIGGAAGLVAAGPLGAMVGAGVATAANSIYRGALMAYRMEDDLFKAAAFFKARSMGMTLDEAAEHVRTWFPYYDKPTSTTIKMAGRTALPFVSFFRESGRIFAKALKERPLSLAATIAIPTLITAVSQAMLGLDDRDEDDVKKAMRGKGAKLLGLTPLAGVPIFSMLIPVRTESGQLQQIDLSSTHPFADFMADRVENWHNDPWWQTWARSALSNPILGSVYSAATGRDPFGDRVLWDSTYTPEEKAKAIWGHAWKTAVPPLAPGGTNWSMIEQSTRRQANKTLALRSPVQAVARGVAGIDIRSADPDIYAKADAFRQSRGLPSSESNVAWPTDAAGRARKALFEELVQPAPDTAALTKILQNLNDLGKPVRTLPDVLKLLDARTPDAVINPKSLRVPFRASLAPEAKRVLTTALTEFAKARSNSGAAFAKARGAVKATTRAPTTP